MVTSSLPTFCHAATKPAPTCKKLSGQKLDSISRLQEEWLLLERTGRRDCKAEAKAKFKAW